MRLSSSGEVHAKLSSRGDTPENSLATLRPISAHKEQATRNVGRKNEPALDQIVSVSK